MNCKHPELYVVLTPSGPHYGKLLCRDCEAFLGWEKKPETVERERLLAEFLKASRSVKMTEWEKKFIEQIEGRKPSPKQLEIVSKIALKYELPNPAGHA